MSFVRKKTITKMSRRAASFIALFLLCGILSFWCLGNSRNYQRSKIAKALKSIDPEDRFYLDFYFRSLLFEDPLAYVLCGDKPMGLSGFWNPTNSSDSPLEPGCSQKSIIMKRGYELHKKY